MGVIGQIECHERRKGRAGGLRGGNAGMVVPRLVRPRYRRNQVWHDDRAREGFGRLGNRIGQGGAVANVQVPVIRASEGKRGGRQIGLSCRVDYKILRSITERSRKRPPGLKILHVLPTTRRYAATFSATVFG